MGKIKRREFYCPSEDGVAICAITHYRCRILDMQDCKDCMVAKDYKEKIKNVK